MIFFLFIIILSSIVGIWYFLNYQEFLAKKEELEGRKKQMQQQIEQAANISKDLEEKQRQQKDAEAELKKWRQKIQTKANIPEILRQIENIGLNNKVKFNEITIENIAPYEGYSEIPIQIHIMGMYHDVGRFLRTLEYAKLFNVNGGTLTLQPYVGRTATNKPEIHMTLNVKSYIINLAGGDIGGEM